MLNHNTGNGNSKVSGASGCLEVVNNPIAPLLKIKEKEVI
jgi:hypothetical protein